MGETINTSTPQVFEKGGKTYVVDPVDGPLEVKYGLPPIVRYCRRCILSNQRAAPTVVTADRPNSIKPVVVFHDDGICDACKVVEGRAEIDWKERERELIALLDRYRSRNGSYDCLVPGSGGKDSVFASHILKTRYGMHPLTVTWAPHLYTDVGWRNFQSWIHKAGFDNYLFTPDGVVHRKLTRLAYENLLHPFQPFILGQRYFPVKLSKRLGIPLVFYGETAAEYGSDVRDDLKSLRPPQYYTGDPKGDLFFGGVHLSDLPKHGVLPGQLEPYLPMTYDEVLSQKIEVHLLGYFLRWVPQDCYYYSVEHSGFEANEERTQGTYTKYNSIDDKIDPFHYWTGLVKFGIGRCIQEAAQEVRHGHISREEAIALASRYDQEFPSRFFSDFLDYLEMDAATFHEIADRFRSPHLWRFSGNRWELRHPPQ